MAIQGLRELMLDVSLGAHGVPATVTRPAPDDDPVSTTVVWQPNARRTRSDEVYPFRNELDQRQAERRVVSVPVSGLSTLPIGSVITAALIAGGTAKSWRVEELEREEAEERRVVVVPVPE